ncbi:MAG: GNAT family N-acetyltransferase [candidate division Zixibacteria bacterium]|nr:GNAT family N-acetyltransferase [candidate division Zixibacteria bacterium]
MLVFTTNKKHLERHFQKDPVLFGYHQGDLDDFYFPDCQWAADYHQRARIEELILIYSGLKTATVLALGLTDRFEQLLEETIELLPKEFYCHFFKSCRSVFGKLYDEKPLGKFLKMKLIDRQKCESLALDKNDNIVRLELSHYQQLQELYEQAYPDNYFNNSMLETGKYFGYIIEQKLVAVAGVHVYSKKYKIAVLGNIATYEKFRSKGLATKVTAALVRELAGEGLLVALNVKSDNEAAIKCYAKLGFEKTHEYEESFFYFGLNLNTTRSGKPDFVSL